MFLSIDFLKHTFLIRLKLKRCYNIILAKKRF